MQIGLWLLPQGLAQQSVTRASSYRAGCAGHGDSRDSPALLLGSAWLALSECPGLLWLLALVCTAGIAVWPPAGRDAFPSSKQALWRSLESTSQSGAEQRRCPWLGCAHLWLELRTQCPCSGGGPACRRVLLMSQGTGFCRRVLPRAPSTGRRQQGSFICLSGISSGC